MPLDAIRQIMGRRDFDVLSALESHKTELRKRIARMSILINTVDTTISHLKGKSEMSKKQFFEGFSDAQQAEYEKEASQMYDPATVKASIKKWNAYTVEEKKGSVKREMQPIKPCWQRCLKALTLLKPRSELIYGDARSNTSGFLMTNS